jgi:S1-C subfamily serine protease
MADSLVALSDAFAAVVAASGPSIVQVNARRRMPASGVVWSEDGLIVTAHHVVKASNVSVNLADGETVAAELVGRDPTTDLAVLRASASGLQNPTWQDEIGVGSLVLALARPGHTVQATLGVVSALGGAWRTPAGGQIERYLQTDVLMYPGFSGGPLVGAGGQFLGLNSSALVRGTSVSIPPVTLRRVVDALVAHGRVQRGYLGVSTQLARLPQALRDQLGQATGLLVVAVEADSPAEAAGLVLGDTIISLGGESVRHHDDLVRLLSGDQIGQKVPVGIVRGGEVQTLNVTIGERD